LIGKEEVQVKEDDVMEEVKSDESALGEEDVDKEEFHKVKENVFAIYLSDEETEEFL